MEGKEQATKGRHGLLVIRTLTTVCLSRCDDATLVYNKSCKTSTPAPQVDGGERCPTA